MRLNQLHMQCHIVKVERQEQRWASSLPLFGIVDFVHATCHWGNLSVEERSHELIAAAPLPLTVDAQVTEGAVIVDFPVNRRTRCAGNDDGEEASENEEEVYDLGGEEVEEEEEDQDDDEDMLGNDASESSNGADSERDNDEIEEIV